MDDNLDLIDIDILTTLLRLAIYLPDGKERPPEISVSFEKFVRLLNFTSYLDVSRIKESLQKLSHKPLLLNTARLRVFKEVVLDNDSFTICLDPATYQILKDHVFFRGVNFLFDCQSLASRPQGKEEVC